VSRLDRLLRRRTKPWFTVIVLPPTPTVFDNPCNAPNPLAEDAPCDKEDGHDGSHSAWWWKDGKCVGEYRWPEARR
jgi:hypothetical protein